MVVVAVALAGGRSAVVVVGCRWCRRCRARLLFSRAFWGSAVWGLTVSGVAVFFLVCDLLLLLQATFVTAPVQFLGGHIWPAPFSGDS